MRKSLHILGFLLLCSVTMAQQDALYSQYMFNAFAINPAYAGSRESMSLVLLGREQWVGLDGAPSTQSFALHTPFHGRNLALGLNAFNDNIGPMQNSGVYGTYAYHLHFTGGKLALGLRAGVFNTRYHQERLDYRDDADQFASIGSLRSSTPSFDFGAYYYTNRFYIGGAATHLTEQRLEFGELPDLNVSLKRHYMFTIGRAFRLNEASFFKPSVMVKMVENAPVNVDVNASFLLRKVFWVGASFRSSGTFVLLTEYNLTDFVRVGYSYDIVTNPLKRHNGGSHEVMVGFDFNISKSRSIPTRLL